METVLTMMECRRYVTLEGQVCFRSYNYMFRNS